MLRAARLCLALALVALSSCSEADGLGGTSWQAVELGPRPTVPDVISTIAFDDGQVSGDAGCNSYTGTYEADPVAGAPKGGPPTIAIGQIGSTEMACDDLVMAQEEAYLAALVRATTYRVVTDRLELYGGERLLIAFVRTET